MTYKINVKDIFKITYIVIITAIIISFFWLFNFFNNNVYLTIKSESTDFKDNVNINLQKLDIKKFEEIITEIDKKKEVNNIEVNNFFH
jgi:hypothetical protein